MKKAYIAPAVEVTIVNASAILAGSPEMSADPTKTSSTMEAKSFLDFIGSNDEE